jgi:diadenosine tetraphosphatase ApaH/serine/threonine PP2A family protein phosphatase
MCDSARWERFSWRDDDVVISTPSKCGTTWMQQIVGSLVLGRPELGGPLSTISPWLDMLIRTDEQVFGLLEAQAHRRFVKTHTPLDGVPYRPTVTYFAVVRHPLDVVLSDLDHDRNSRRERAVELRESASGAPDAMPDLVWPDGDGPRERLLWFIDNDNPPIGSGPYGLADFCQQVSTFWERRHLPNVHLVHYQDLWDDLDGEMRRIAAALGVTADQERWPELVAAASLASMRRRADHTVPEADSGLWHRPADFFRTGGRRDWGSLLSASEVVQFHRRLRELAGDATDWVLQGRSALSPAPTR